VGLEPVEGTQEAAYIPEVALQIQEASAAAETPAVARIQVGGSPEDHHSQPETVVAAAVIPKAEEEAAHSVAVVAAEQNCSLHLDDRRIQGVKHLVVDLPFVVGRRALLEGQRGRCR
jgi:hypothetical protein